MLTNRGLLAVGSCLIVLGCGEGKRAPFYLPTSPTQSSTPPPVFIPPPPRQWPPYEITDIDVGDVVNRTNVDAPECLDELGWPCIYFRLTAPSSGSLDLTLSFALGTQGSQGVDLTVREAGGRAYVWAHTFRQTAGRSEVLLTAPVLQGLTYDITLWYTFPKLEYELRSLIR